MPKDDLERRLAKETAAAQAIKESLQTQTDDEDAIRDTLEGETNLHELLGAVMGEIRECEIMMAGLDDMTKRLGERRGIFGRRIERLRAAIERGMAVGDIKTLQLADATLSLRAVAPGLEIVDEAKIPARFWKAQDPKLDKSALKAALKDGEQIEGATLGNGGITLSVRRK